MTDIIAMRMGDREIHWNVSPDMTALLAQNFVQAFGPAEEGHGFDPALPLDPEPWVVNSFDLGQMRFAQQDEYAGYCHNFEPREGYSQNRKDYPR